MAEDREMKGEGWVPRTRLGRMVLDGSITSIDEIFMEGLKIQESEIVDILLPDLEQNVLNINLVQKQTDAGEKSRFKSLVVVGNYAGYVGLGTGKAKNVRTAIEKGVIDAKLNLIPVRRGCGSWECGCSEPHSIPFRTTGKCGSVRVELLPAPKGLGIVAAEIPKTVISFSGIKDCWTRSYGSTRTPLSFAYATHYALRNTYRIVTPRDWAR
ncbi:MAG: 30S ribosomal protein S5 [Candidatus Bathyarchaeia archaeon]